MPTPLNRPTFSSPTSLPRYKFAFTVPTTHLAPCKAAVFSAGAGAHPNSTYKNVCFETSGIGHFIPTEGAHPDIGQVGKAEAVEETRVEVMCVGGEVVKKAILELKKAHPYEECTYDIFKMEDF
ncbi:MAG: hypothetical protein M1834_007331 [Cirrosporium novae-zelandiae]|nr:MAG: hypothetical protein M1834_007331 [Cirrosporium novae-zelandiae]